MATLIGNIFKEAKICESEGGQFIAFTLVEQDSYKTKEGKRKYLKTYFNCVMWNANKLASYLTKDIPVKITGNITAKSYKDGAGKAKASISLSVKTLEFIPYPKAESAEGEAIDETFDEPVETA